MESTKIKQPITQGWSIFVFIPYPLLVQNSTDLQRIFEIQKKV